MSRYIYLIFAFFYLACGTHSTEKERESQDIITKDSIPHMHTTANIGPDSLEDSMDIPYADYSVLIADTGTDYYLLRKKMIEIHTQFKIPIDTMGRYYNEDKQLIALPENAEDEIYAGEYFFRRYPGENLSLEYLHYYLPSSNEKTIALFVGIYETDSAADETLRKIRTLEKKAFKIKATMYMGCMH